MVKGIPLIFLLALVLLAFPVSAENILFTEQLELLSAELTGKELPAPLGTLFGNQRVIVHLSVNGTEETLSLVTENNKVTSVTAGEVDNPTLRGWISEEALAEIINSKNPSLALQKSLDREEIRYEAVGFFNKIKFSVVSVFARLFAGKMSDTENIEENKENTVVAQGVLKESDEENALPEEVEQESGNQLTGQAVKMIPKTGETHTIQLIDGGFDIKKISIAVGDTIVFENIREKIPSKALIVGTTSCRSIKSEFLEPGDVFSHTFDNALECVIADGVFQKEGVRVTVR